MLVLLVISIKKFRIFRLREVGALGIPLVLGFLS
jgi:hypothetical protein